MAKEGCITVAGLGSGDESDLSLGVIRVLREAEQLYLRTGDHPAVKWLKAQGLRFTTFDAVYERHGRFEDVYDDIARRLIAAARGRHIVYAVPGHPAVAEQTTRILKERSRAQGIDVRIQGGRSFLETAFTRLNLDPIDGFLLLDGLNLTAAQLNPRLPTLIAQVYDQLTASDVKLTLMARYPDDFAVTVAHSLGIPEEEQIRSVPLFEMDHGFPVSSRSVVYVPAAGTPLRADPALISRVYELQQEASALGFDWEDIVPVAAKVEEELRECLRAGPEDVAAEVGDLLFSVVNLARFLDVHPEEALQLAETKFKTRFEAVKKKANTALHRLSAEEMDALWEIVKQEEKN